MHMRIRNIGRWARRQSKVIAAVAVGVAIGGVGPALVRAAIPDGNTIHACYANSAGPLGLTPQGDVRIIDSAATCPTGTTAINWDQHSTGGTGGFVASLVNADLTNASLPSRNFVGVDMHGAIFTGANIRGSDFHGANLTGATIGGGSTVGANLFNFTNVDWHGANMSNATFQGRSSGSNLTGVNFTAAHIAGTVTEGDFQGSNFTNTTVEGQFNGSNFHNVDLRTIIPVSGGGGWSSGYNLSGANFSGVHFTDYFIISGGNIAGTNFSNTTFSRVDLTGNTSTAGVNFTNAHFDNSDFTGTNLSSATLTGTIWSNTTCPDGTNSDSNGNTCTGHLVP